MSTDYGCPSNRDDNNLYGIQVQTVWTCSMSDYGCRPVTLTTIVCMAHKSKRVGRACPYRLWLSSYRMTIIVCMHTSPNCLDVYVIQTMVVQLLDDNHNLYGIQVQTVWTCSMSDYGCRPVTGTTIVIDMQARVWTVFHTDYGMSQYYLTTIIIDMQANVWTCSSQRTYHFLSNQK